MQATSISNLNTFGADDAVRPARPEDVADLFQELRRPLFRYLLSLSLSYPEAEDAVQETFLRLCQQFQAGACFNLRPWLFRVAHNLALDQHRRRLREPSPILGQNSSADDFTAESAVVLKDTQPTPEQEAMERQREQRLRSALARLSAHQQHCLHLRAEGLRYREIGEVLGVGTSTVADWVQAALERLGRDLK